VFSGPSANDGICALGALRRFRTGSNSRAVTGAGARAGFDPTPESSPAIR
jgi:hypothetical protein